MPLPQHPREAERLRALQELDILDTGPEHIFEHLVEIASISLQVPIALLSLVDEDRQWFKARVGLDAIETPRCQSFCAHAILESAETLVIENAERDPRFASNPLVTDYPAIRAYAGVVVHCPFTELPLGTLCVIDSSTRTYTDQQLGILKTLAKQVEHLLQLRKVARATDDIACSLAESDAKLRGIIDNSQSLLGLVDAEGTILDINRTALEIVHAPIDSVIGKPIWNSPWWTHSEELQERLKAAIRRAAAGSVDRFEATHPTHEHGLMDVDFSVSPVRLNGEVTYLITEGRDVTLQKSREREIEIYLAQLLESNNELEQFAYVASHDLRSPLRGIASLARFIEEDEADRLSESSRDYFSKLRRRLSRMQTLLDDLLKYSRVGYGNDEPVKVDMNVMLEEILDLLSIPAGFEVRVSGSLPTLVTHASPLRQTLVNIIGNAVKHHDRDSGLITLAATPARGLIEFRVTDDGPGIDASLHEKVFEMFRTLRRRDDVEGSGMGLAIVRKLVRRHGGNVTLESGTGRGSTFVFTWPARLSLNSESACP